MRRHPRPRPRRRPTLSRRGLLAGSAAVFAGSWAGPAARADRAALSANEELRFACIGVGGKGKSDASDAARHGRVVAIADVDADALNRARTLYGEARPFADFRRMLDAMAGEIDAVTVSTPDHTHLVAAGQAIGLGKHCYCQKPLARTIWETRRLAELARAHKVATQMGNQGTANPALRRIAAFIAAGGLGRVTQVHVWTNRPGWPQDGVRPAPAAVPAGLDWDLWLGPAPLRPYGAGYHPFGWRGFWDFGSGALGDMGCHALNMPFMALDLRGPVAVRATTAGHGGETFPKWSVIDFEFPERGGRGPVKATWYDGGRLPAADLFAAWRDRAAAGPGGAAAPPLPDKSGVLVVGEKDSLYSPGDFFRNPTLASGAAMPEVAFEPSPGHFRELVDAIRGGPPPRSNFPDYAAPLNETVLAGNLAVWLAPEAGVPGARLEWPAGDLGEAGPPEIRHVVTPAYRAGWSG